MREIKFRVWSILRKSFVYPVIDITNDFNDMTHENRIFEQYIERKDKKGVEIYEGDITNYGIVTWFNSLSWDCGGSNHPGFYFKPIGYDLLDEELDYYLGFDDDVEVIGNIHENKELLDA